ncbi:MAG: hypothetical protein L6R19_04755 [Alphaproteobacteria bacterium]|nr:hypothetical protein [Alphaproteobacteria bacterium]
MLLLGGFLLGVAAARAADPGDPAAAAPTTRYRSAFDGYERWRDGGKAPWRDANEAVGRMGGHMGHMEDASPQAPGDDQPPERPAGAAQPPSDGQHQHHKP